MHIDATLRQVTLEEVGDEARRLEGLGFDAVWMPETNHDPFLVLAQAALATGRLGVTTAVAIAFARSPFSMALAAWDLQRASRGRLTLGLGTQVRAHVERRFSAEFDHPAARVTDYIRCVRAIWETFQTGRRPAYEGPFYRFTLINDFFNPGPIDHPAIPVHLAGVNPRMCRAAGEVADGFHVHPIHSPGYLRDVVRPAIDEGARTRGKTVEDLELLTSVFFVAGETEAERARAELSVRQQVAFYASTPSYRTFLDYHGYAEVGRTLSEHMRRGELEAMVRLVPDGLLAEVAVSGSGAALATALRERYAGGLVQRVALYGPVPADADEDAWRALTRAVKD